MKLNEYGPQHFLQVSKELIDLSGNIDQAQNSSLRPYQFFYALLRYVYIANEFYPQLLQELQNPVLISNEFQFELMNRAQDFAKIEPRSLITFSESLQNTIGNGLIPELRHFGLLVDRAERIENELDEEQKQLLKEDDKGESKEIENLSDKDLSKKFHEAYQAALAVRAKKDSDAHKKDLEKIQAILDATQQRQYEDWEKTIKNPSQALLNQFRAVRNPQPVNQPGPVMQAASQALAGVTAQPLEAFSRLKQTFDATQQRGTSEYQQRMAELAMLRTNGLARRFMDATLTSREKKLLVDSRYSKSVLKNFLKLRVAPAISSRIYNLDLAISRSGLGERSRGLLKRMTNSEDEEHEKKTMSGIVKAIVGFKVKQFFDNVAKVKDTVEKVTGITKFRRVTQNVVEAWEGTKNSVTNWWEKTPVGKGFAVAAKSVRTVNGIIKLAGAGLRGGASTALLAGGAVILLSQSPQLAIAAALTGGAVGTVRGVMDYALRIPLKEINFNKDYLGGFYERAIKYRAAINPLEYADLPDEFKRIANTADLAKYRRLRNFHNALRGVNGGVIAFALGTFAFNPVIGLALGAGTLFGTYALHTKVDDFARTLRISRTAQHLMEFPGMGVFDVAKGSFSVSNSLNFAIDTIQKEGIGGYLRAQMEFNGLQDIFKAVDNIGYVTGSNALTGWMIKAARAYSVIPGIVKLAPLITVGGYLAGSVIFGYAITGGGLLAATGLGILATGVGIIGSMIGGPLGFAIGFGATNLLLAKPAAWLGNWIDELVGRANTLLDLLPRLFGIYSIVKALQDIFDVNIKNLTSYANFIPAVFTFITMFSVISDYSLRYAPAASQSAPSVSDTSSYYQFPGRKEPDYAYFTQPLVYNCTDGAGNPMYAEVAFTVDEILPLETNGVTKINVKGEKDGQVIIYKNLSVVESGIVSDIEVKENSVVGNCG